MAACTINLPAFTALETKLETDKSEKRFFVNAKMGRHLMAENKAVVGHMRKEDYKLRSKEMDSVSLQVSQQTGRTTVTKFKSVQSLYVIR